ncbi:MAG: DUF192 domain-containing protein [Hyphomicrobium sp.]
MAVTSQFAPPSMARMRVERLTVAPASGAEPRVFTVEIAGSEQEKAVGLMFRTRLSDSEGMLFNYGRARVITMWMRNTYIPLDMLFIRADGVVHRIEARTEPFSDRIISSGEPVAAVLEIAGGAAERLGLNPGDRVLHPAFGSKPPP